MRERLRVAEGRILTEELQPTATMSLMKLFEETAAEQPREHAHRQQESRLAGDPAVAVRGQTTAGHDAVHVRMVRQRRAPGVQDQRHTDLRAEMLRVSGNSAQRPAATSNNRS